MPLSIASPGEEASIIRVGGSSEVRHHLAELGFVPGAKVSVVNVISGNVIVNVMDARVAISKELALKIMI